MTPSFLKGIRFVDLTWAGAGPFSTKIFSDFGADVIKVESRSRPDPVRIGGPYRDKIAGINRSGYFASRNTGKRSLAMNLKNPAAREHLFALIRDADVVSNNFGPGAMERLGLGYDEIKAIKPDIIYLAMPMYGENGPRANLTGVGMTISAVTGLMWQTGYPHEEPLGPGTHFPDHAANPYHAAFAVLAGLRHRRTTGRGLKIDLSQVESTINVMGLPVLEYMVTGEERERPGNRSPFHAPHNIFRCAGTDEWCAVAVLTDAQWQSLCKVIGHPADPALATTAGRLAAIDQVEGAVATWIADKGPDGCHDDAASRRRAGRRRRQLALPHGPRPATRPPRLLANRRSPGNRQEPLPRPALYARRRPHRPETPAFAGRTQSRSAGRAARLFRRTHPGATGGGRAGITSRHAHGPALAIRRTGNIRRQDGQEE